MTQLTVTDLENAKLDVDTIANIANSIEESITDRNGNQRRTIYSLQNEYPNASENAAAAALSETNAATSETNASIYKDETLALKEQAEVAANVSLLNAGIFASTSAGIAATVSGDYFSIVSPDDNEYLILYLNNSGVAEEQKRYPSATPVENIRTGDFSELGFSFKSLSSESGYVYGIVDSQNRAALLIAPDGSITFGKYYLQQIVTQLEIDVTELKAGDFSELGFSFRNLSPESGYAFALQDAGGKSVFLVKPDGTVEIPKYDKQQYIPQSMINDTGYCWGILDANKRMALGVDLGGSVVFSGSKYIPQSMLSDTGYSWGILDANKRMALGVDLEGSLVFSGSKYIKPRRNLWCLGDSLTAGAGDQITWREALPSLLTKSRTITNWGIGGQTSTQIAARAGAYNTLLTLSGNQIPADSSVTVTARTISLLTANGTQAITGYLNGIAGTLSRDGSDNYTFTRTTAGTATYVAPNSPFIPDIFSSDFTTFIIFLGRNNLSLPNDIIRDIDACVALQKTIEKRFLIITPPNGGTLTTGQSTSEGTGSSTLTNIKQVEDYVVQKYGDKVLKVREFSYQFNNGSADDLDDVAKETVPRSLRIDGVHWTTAFHAHVAQWVANQINTRGW